MLTFNGNENILQNDMGNAQVMDAKTGNMIGLSDGFVPVGIKEHGGVLYIASYNPKTKQGELGTIPSPRIEYTLQDQSREEQIGKLLAGVNNSDILVNDKISHDYILIDTETLFRVGDQFIVQLDLRHIPELYDQTILTHFENNKITGIKENENPFELVDCSNVTIKQQNSIDFCQCCFAIHSFLYSSEIVSSLRNFITSHNFPTE